MVDKINSESTSTTLDWARSATAVAIVAAGIYANSYFAAESLLLRVIGLLLGAGVAGWLAGGTKRGRAFIDLCLEARIEIRKVVWPTRQETVQTTLVVLVVIVIVALILWLLDWGLNAAVSSVIG
jgi:preprotein translocase subunit SecE